MLLFLLVIFFYRTIPPIVVGVDLFEFKTGTLLLNPIYTLAIPILKRKRGYMPKEEKIRVSNNVPDWFKQVVCGLMLSDASIRMNGSQATMSVQQTHKELTEEVWKMCFQLNLVLSDIHIIDRINRKLVYSFQTLSLPFSLLYIRNGTKK
uniref:LAGLIDADG homing endonuclease n=1 Tax=Cyclocybe aegerita TaxID=1973307 RepID=A0A884P6K1_CYCAE|nr:hypothetical protein K4014_mgp14 [Cyclocybe aegerita]QQP21461.1 hypothetical protein [Cyclocybe aegerita]